MSLIKIVTFLIVANYVYVDYVVYFLIFLDILIYFLDWCFGNGKKISNFIKVSYIML